MGRHFNMEPVGQSHCLLFLGHVNVKSGFLGLFMFNLCGLERPAQMSG